MVGLAAVPVGCGGAWPDNESTRRAKLAARTARGRAAAHEHAKQPSPTARPDGARNTRGAHSNTGIQAERPASSVARWTPPRPGRRPSVHRADRQLGGRSRRYVPAAPVGSHGDGAIQAERPASSVARWRPPRPASCAAWVRHEKPSARYTASGWADRDGSSECEATATDRS